MAAAGPLFDLTFHTELGKAIFTFLTPGQTSETVKEISRDLENTWKGCIEERNTAKSAQGAPKKKKRRTSENGAAAVASTSISEEKQSVRFALLCRLVLPILSNLPTRSLTSDTMTEVQSLMRELREGVILPAVRAALSGEDTCWGAQVADAAALRLMYGLQQVRNGIWEQGPDEEMQVDVNDDGMLGKAANLLRSDGTLPELAVEIVSKALLCLITLAWPLTRHH